MLSSLLMWIFSFFLLVRKLSLSHSTPNFQSPFQLASIEGASGDAIPWCDVNHCYIWQSLFLLSFFNISVTSTFHSLVDRLSLCFHFKLNYTVLLLLLYSSHVPFMPRTFIYSHHKFSPQWTIVISLSLRWVSVNLILTMYLLLTCK